MHKQLWLSALFASFPIAIVAFLAFKTPDIHITPLPSIDEKTQPATPAPDKHVEPPIATKNTIPHDCAQGNDQILMQKKTGTERTIKVANKITKKMISYNKCFVSYTPNFALIVNDQILRPGREESITITDNKLIVTYSYNFLKGYKKGKRSVEFQVSPNQDLYEITFSWHNDWRVIIRQATPQKVNVIH